ncbi:CACTA en-spm transposon protein [Cucumis melo var. makuwa]|uniref:CACTA en-spm transposon protein n=1 Tax=Cucumis melo var. makuwa TaxID=1194695 RepID=A0A5D3E488_CUCMM|nr:CACTA en-spm transposon protein [Cucumis melo var. makuwa]TYK30887.1 CACTA en-spm transposon protein [Cucumis melo var. makuwa]
MSLLIPSPRSPGREIDVYLQPYRMIRVSDLDRFQEDIIIILCMISYNWMYPIARSLRTLKQKHLRLIRRHDQNAMDLYKRHERAFPEWFRAQVLKLRESENLLHDFFSLVMGPSFDVRCYNGCIMDGLKLHTSELDSRRTTQNSGLMVIGESDASGSGVNNFYGIMSSSYPRNNFLKTNVMFFEFADDLDNLMGWSSSVGDNWANGSIPMMIAPSVEKPISPHVIRFSLAIGVSERHFSFAALNVCTFKEFRGDFHRHFKKYNDLKEARANPSNLLVGCDEEWHFFCDHYMSCAFQEQSRTNKAARQKQSYNHSSGSKSFLRRQHELVEQRGESVDQLMLKLQSQPTLEGSQPLFRDVICDKYWVDDLGYYKSLGWEPKLKAARRRVRAVPRRHVQRPQKERFNYKLSLIKLWNGLKSRQEITKH